LPDTGSMLISSLRIAASVTPQFPWLFLINASVSRLRD